MGCVREAGGGRRKVEAAAAVVVAVAVAVDGNEKYAGSPLRVEVEGGR